MFYDEIVVLPGTLKELIRQYKSDEFPKSLYQRTNRVLYTEVRIIEETFIYYITNFPLTLQYNFTGTLVVVCSAEFKHEILVHSPAIRVDLQDSSGNDLLTFHLPPNRAFTLVQMIDYVLEAYFDSEISKANGTLSRCRALVNYIREENRR